MLVLSRRQNESIVINSDITITVLQIRGDRVRIGVEAPKEVAVHRREVLEESLAGHGRASAGPQEVNPVLLGPRRETESLEPTETLQNRNEWIQEAAPEPSETIQHLLEGAKMTATLQEPGARTQHLERGEQIHVERTDISFHNVKPDRVRITIALRNQGGRRSSPTTLLLHAAPFGAFVSWEPLTVLPVPELQPGESIDLSTEVSQPQPTALGDFADVSPRAVLAATNSGDRPPRTAQPAASPFQDWLPLRRRRRSAPAGFFKSPLLPVDLFELVGRKNHHWAGNLNVFIGRKAVERHLAQALRIYPGRANMAMFVVGTHPDAYAFDLRGDGAAWDPVLYDRTFGQSLLVDTGKESPIRQSEWVRTRGRHLVLLAIYPPGGCQQGILEVHVTQRSSGKTAIVEFSLAPTAKGPGCYVL